MRILLLLLVLAITLPARDVTITILATTDMHGNLYPYDYLSAKPSTRGLAKIATLVAAERKSAPDALLLDCGDTIQGAPLESVYQQYVATAKLPANTSLEGAVLAHDPMMLAMNYLRYDAMAVGNHEYNYGLGNLDKARSEAKFPWLSANTKGGSKPFDAYIVKEINGVKVGIIGITTPAVPTWEKPENYKGYRFEDGRAALQAAVSELKSQHKADVVVVISHSGLKGSDAPSNLKENIVEELAQVAGVDAIVFGHTHNELAGKLLGNVLVAQPKNWAMSLARLDLRVAAKPAGGYSITSKTSKLIPVTDATPSDDEVLKIAKPYHDVTERYLNTVVGEAKASIDGAKSRIEDTAIIDAIQRTQLYFSKADVSFASSFNPRASIPKGPVTIRQIAALYLYDNELYAIEGTGKMVKDALENSARFYKTCPDTSCNTSPLINRKVIGYNYDMAEGVTYEIDLTRPEGDRIQNLKLDGRPLAPDQKLRIALNNYRAAGSNGYTMFRGIKPVWRSYDEIRDLIINYYDTRPLPSAPNDNWRIVPEPAHQTLEREIKRDSGPQTK